ncbi:cysteine--tRNA ligase [Candidatus Saccharibacteria bacterium]|nr:cysteine--tRNA ligase [Candidatus Saccharibacteria bacterium]
MKLYNTLSRKVEEIKPLEDNKISLYTCGLTVYSQPHIGNWVAYIYWDILVRTLKANGFDVTRVQNITDVGHLTSDEDAGEDKMEKGARTEGLTAWDVAEKYIKIADHEAYELLGLLRPDHMPRATEYIEQQIDFVKELEIKGFTYVIEDGVYFDTSKLKDYGKLAKLDIEGLKAGARVDDSGKKNPTDFALWKLSPNPPAGGSKRDMEWDSPWGKGFPGWHLECSVMVRELLGDQIDIHTGGIDHIPVHHTNEIAQTEAVTGKQFSQIWVHANHIKVDGTKMSKSLGNIYTLQDILDRGYSLDAFKLMILSKHYRTEGNFTWEILESAQNRLKRWKNISDLRFQTTDKATDYVSKIDWIIFAQYLNEDLDTPEAISYLDRSFFDPINENKFLPTSMIDDFEKMLELIKELLGIDLTTSKDINTEKKALLAERQKARENKNWAESDRIRDELKEQGIGINDGPNGQIWYRL